MGQRFAKLKQAPSVIQGQLVNLEAEILNGDDEFKGCEIPLEVVDAILEGRRVPADNRISPSKAKLRQRQIRCRRSFQS